MKIVFSSNISWSIYNFRTPLLKALQNDGHDIYTVANRDEYAEKLVKEGFHFEAIDLNNNSKNPIEDLKTIFSYYKIYKKIKPDVICQNAIKPNIYGTIAAGFLGIPTVNNISGLGTLFIKESFSTLIAKFLYKFSQKRANIIFFQNNDDLSLFTNNGLVDSQKCMVIPGSGVNTDKFKMTSRSLDNKIFSFLFVGRLINDKGIREYIEAISILKSKKYVIKAKILGPLYQSNSTAITIDELDKWIKSGVIEYLGETNDVYEEMIKIDCLVLPSYREGLSKVLIEASSVGVPIVTTNVPGCKDVVLDNETGFLCEVKNATDLALKMEKMLNLKKEHLIEMGIKARERAITVFDEKIIINHYKEAIYSLVKL